MNNHPIIFDINDSVKIVVETEMRLDQLTCYCQVPILLQDNTHQSVLSINDIHENMIVFRDQLTQVLHGTLTLHASIKLDIGYVYNEYLELVYNRKSTHTCNIEYAKRDGIDSWVGNDYKLWGYDLLTSWLYNDSDNSIIFEVTPVYPGSFDDSEKKEKLISYEQWIKSYKPYFITTISRSLAEQWLDQADNIVKYIEKKICCL